MRALVFTRFLLGTNGVRSEGAENASRADIKRHHSRHFRVSPNYCGFKALRHL